MPDAQQVLHDRYRLLQKLGQTTGRQTWLAEDLAQQPASQVIVKLLAFADQVNWETLKLFEREANILRQLDHPQIPRYRDTFSLDDRVLWFGLVQELIPGASLKDLLNQGKRFSEKQVCQIATEVLQILIYLQDLNPPVFHRDIKPSNLIWGKDEHIYLIDFGAVQDKAVVEGATFTVVGTYGYAPMEQFGGRTVPSSDLYALGATLIHLLTAIAPADLPQHNLRLQFADKVKIRPSVVKWLEKITAPNAIDRYPSAQSALVALQSALQTSPTETQTKPETESLESGQPTTITYHHPSRRVDLYHFPQSLVIRIRSDQSGVWAIVGGILLGVVAVFVSMLIPFPFPAPFFIFSILLLINGMIRTASVITFTYSRFTHYKEVRFLAYVHQWLFEEAPISTIRDVIQHDLVLRKGGKTTTTAHVVVVQTQNRDYFIGKFPFFDDSQLSWEECTWLVQEIKHWIAANRHQEGDKS